MTKENKELLLKDLCIMLPYNVIVHIKYNTGERCYGELTPKDIQWFIDSKIKEIKPYLRPMSSMTEDEFLEYHNIKYNKVTYKDKWKRIDVGKYHDVGIIPIEDYLDWLNAHHFDYRGLIEKGLALEATEGMYK